MKLTAPEPADVNSIFEWENSVDRLLHGRTGLPYSLDDVAEYVKNYHQISLDCRCVRLMVRIQENGVDPIGICDLYDIDFAARKAFVSMYIDAPYRNQGYGLTALTQLCDFARDHLGLFSLAACISSENTVSQKLFLKAGFSVICQLPKWTRGSNGSLIDAFLLQKIIEC